MATKGESQRSGPQVTWDGGRPPSREDLSPPAASCSRPREKGQQETHVRPQPAAHLPPRRARGHWARPSPAPGEAALLGPSSSTREARMQALTPSLKRVT